MDDGRQHDAQEFLSFLINGLNDEYVKVMKLFKERLKSEEENNGSLRKSSSDNEKQSGIWGANISAGKSVVKILKSGESSDSWEAVTSKGQKRSQARLEPEEVFTTKSDISPISKMFNGTTAYKKFKYRN